MATQIYPVDGDPLHAPNIVTYVGSLAEWGSTPEQRDRVMISTPDGNITMPLREWVALTDHIIAQRSNSKLYIVADERTKDDDGLCYLLNSLDSAIRVAKDHSKDYNVPTHVYACVEVSTPDVLQ